MSLKLFFDVILKGESKTYNDHNWYKTGKKLSGYIEGRNTVMYGGLKKPLSEYTIGEIKQFQAQSRGSANGQLWAVGRYQMIPESLKGQQKFSKIPDSAKFDKKTQDIIGESFLKARNKLWKYIKGEIPDTTTNLNAAIVDVAKTWSSVGVPYAMKGHHRMIEKDQSYYTGGGDRASVKSETVAQALKGLRNFYTGVGEVIEDVEEAIEETAKFGKKNWIPIVIVLAGLGGLTYYLIKSKTIKLK